jgi:hypothetical protein
VSVRMHSHDVKAKYMAHVETHLTAQKDSVLRACPTSMESGDGIQATCGETTPMTKMQLKEHLVEDHNMMFSLKKPKRAGKAGGEDDHEKVQGSRTARMVDRVSQRRMKDPRKSPRERLNSNHCERRTLTKDEVNCTSRRSGFTRTLSIWRIKLQTPLLPSLSLQITPIANQGLAPEKVFAFV